MAAGWMYISLPVDAEIDFVDVFYTYNGTHYTYAQSTTTMNETGARLVEPTIAAWDFLGHFWTDVGVTSFKPYFGYVQYWWHSPGSGVDELALYYPYTTKKN